MTPEPHPTEPPATDPSATATSATDPSRTVAPTADASLAGPSVAASAPTPPSSTTGARVAPITFDGLTKRFGPVQAVDDVSFTVQPGRVTGFLGPNGAGKTTTLRMLVGLAKPTAGSARFGAQTYAELASPQQSVGVVLDPAFHPGRTGRDHLRVLAPAAGASDERVDELLELVQLTPAAKRRAGGYSLGMRQRLALAGALLGDPAYLILDEPANGLDPEGIRWLRGFLRDYAAQGRVVLVSSHMLGEVQETADDVAVIFHGRLLRHAPLAEFEVGTPTSRVRVVAGQEAAAVRAIVDAGLEATGDQDGDGPFMRVSSGDTARLGQLLFGAGVVLTELARERISLEESFFRMLAGDAASGGPGETRDSAATEGSLR